MLETLTWWLLVELIGLAVWPVAYRFFRNLPERGYAFVKPLGLLLIAYPFWLFTTFGFLTNTRGAIALVAILVAAASWWFFGRKSPDANRKPLRDLRSAVDSRQTSAEIGASENVTVEDVSRSSPLAPGPTPAPCAPRPSLPPGPSALDWLYEHLTLALAIEAVFTISFFAWTIVRAYMPEITATEKPMEFAFLNGVLQSSSFPPRDPWLAGYAISYYYFGYIIIAMLTLLSGIASSVTFNLGIALLFALAATGAFGLAYDLIESLSFSIFAPVSLLVVSNLEGFFEALHANGFGSLQFWTWLDVKGLADAPLTYSFVPNDNWWWWRASRVVHDVALGQTQEVIDEFPQFSFLLGDMHPHVLALPFVLLALAAAFNLIRRTEFTPSDSRFGLPIPALDFALFPLILGGLFFLNSWDVLPYGFILLGAFAIARYWSNHSWDARASRDLAVFTVMLGGLSVLLYLPFYVGFQSQAGGLLPTFFVKTQLHQYLIMFGLFIFIIGALVARIFLDHRGVRAAEWLSNAAPLFAGLVTFPFAIAILAFALVTLSPALQEQARAAIPGLDGSVAQAVLASYFGPLFSDPWLVILLVLFLTAILVLLRTIQVDASTTFVLLIAFTGLLLTFGVEFVYLRDQFGTRMNTVFKFYFQSWTLFSIAGAYGVFYLSQRLFGLARGAFLAGLTVLVVVSLVYPVLAIPNRADNFGKTPTLDGLAWIRETNPGDLAAIQWLAANAPRGSTIVEAVGGEYSYGNRISMATGLPTVLGWAGHELQWRGNSRLFKDDAAGIDRAADVAQIYQTVDSSLLLTLLNRYDIRFVVVGQMERSQYSLTKSQIDKFGRVMTLVSDNGDVRIYARAS